MPLRAGADDPALRCMRAFVAWQRAWGPLASSAPIDRSIGAGPLGAQMSPLLRSDARGAACC
jgi:hypothetical protein